jgi:hypothetical protein
MHLPDWVCQLHDRKKSKALVLEFLPMTKSISAGWRSPERPVVSWRIHGLMLGLIGALAIGSTWLDARASRPSRAVVGNEPHGTGIIVGNQVIRLWLPENLLEMAVHQHEPWQRRVQADLRAVLDRRGQDRLWYGLTIRTRQADGRSVEITFFRRPCCTSSERFAEFLDVLATAAGNPPDKYAGAEVRVLPGDLPAPQGRQVVEQLVSGL